jgi:cell division septation protein DedD
MAVRERLVRFRAVRALRASTKDMPIGRQEEHVRRNTRWLRSTIALLALGVLPGVAPAQSTKPKDERSAAKEAPAPKDEHAKRFDELKARHERASKDFEAKIQALGDDKAARNKLIEEEMPEKKFFAEYLEFAKTAKGTESAAKALVQAVMMAPMLDEEEAAKAAVQTLLDEHIASPEIAVLVFLAPYVLGEEDGPKAVEKIKEKNTTKPVKAAFLFQEAQTVEQEKGEEAEELLAIYKRLATEFKDLKMPWGEQTYGAIADGWIFVRENLAIGKVAPDFETVDENGVKWKLSDYKGKVVILDFWGMW